MEGIPLELKNHRVPTDAQTLASTATWPPSKLRSKQSTTRNGRARDMLKSLDADDQVETLLHEFRLPHVADQPACALSGRQKKLLSVATALRREPRLLCLDEPTAGVHPEVRHEIIGILKKFNERGVSLLVVEHDMHFIRNLCARCVVLDRGKLIADCPPEELEHNPAVVAAYLGKSVKKGKVAQ
ncbi:MAG: ATP-binding cassette domain-containing protein [Sulfitobacter sp.]|uniref:ATP-binding cassette domain-containing protein n=1 Tax=Sulfitobacter sp. TaxID=1903071 RepID=UPI003297E176